MAYSSYSSYSTYASQSCTPEQSPLKPIKPSAVADADVEAQNVEAQKVGAQNVEAQNVEAQNVGAQNVGEAARDQRRDALDMYAAPCTLFLTLGCLTTGLVLLIIGVIGLTSSCNVKTDAIVMQSTPSSRYGMCDVVLGYSVGSTTYQAVRQVPCSPVVGPAIMPVCYAYRKPSKFRLDTTKAYMSVHKSVVLTTVGAILTVLTCVMPCVVVMVFTAAENVLA